MSVYNTVWWKMCNLTQPDATQSQFMGREAVAYIWGASTARPR